MTEDKVSAILGRSLSDSETQNFDLYLDIATKRLERILGIKLSGVPASNRVYLLAAGSSVLYVDPFYDSDIVTINDESITTYIKQQHDAQEAEWYNTLVFNDIAYRDTYVTVQANWGFASENVLPGDIQILLAHMFSVASSPKIADKVKSKSYEGYSVSYDVSQTESDRLLSEYAGTIAYYQKPQGAVAHGSVHGFSHYSHYPYIG